MATVFKQKISLGVKENCFPLKKPSLSSKLHSDLQYSLKRFWAGAQVQRHETLLRHRVGVGPMHQQQLGALRLTVFTRLVESGYATRRQIYVGPTLQQQFQAICKSSTSRDVEWGGQFLLVCQ